MSDVPGNRPHESATCAFCRIIRHEEQASLVFEDSLSLAFLDQRPLFPGHCLLVPKEHYEILADLPGSFSRLFERRLKKAKWIQYIFILWHDAPFIRGSFLQTCSEPLIASKGISTTLGS